jgi:hypothetical protein
MNWELDAGPPWPPPQLRNGVRIISDRHGKWRTNGERDRQPSVSLRKCRVSYCDLNGVEHAVEVSAESLYEAVAQGLRMFPENDWTHEVGRGQTAISVAVSYPEVQHFAFRILNGGSNRRGELRPR